MNDIVYLSLQTVLDGHSVLIFCPTKKSCEEHAMQIAKAFYDIGTGTNNIIIRNRLRKQLDSERLPQVLETLTQCQAGLDKILNQTVKFAVAFHHAGRQKLKKFNK